MLRFIVIVLTFTFSQTSFYVFTGVTVNQTDDTMRKEHIDFDTLERHLLREYFIDICYRK